MNDDETNGNAAEQVIPAMARGSFPVPRNPWLRLTGNPLQMLRRSHVRGFAEQALNGYITIALELPFGLITGTNYRNVS